MRAIGIMRLKILAMLFLVTLPMQAIAGIFDVLPDDLPYTPKDPALLTAIVTGQKKSLDAAEERTEVSPGVTGTRKILAEITEKYDTVKNVLAKQFNNVHTAFLFAQDIKYIYTMSSRIVETEISLTNMFIKNVAKHPIIALQYYQSQNAAASYLNQIKNVALMFSAENVVGFSSTAKQNQAILRNLRLKLDMLHYSLRSSMVTMNWTIHGWDPTDRLLRVFNGNEGRQIALNVIANF